MVVSTTDVGASLNAAIQGGYVTRLTEETYTISSPIVIRVTKTTQGALGIDGGGATLVSQVTDGSPLIKIVVDPGVDFRYLTLSNFKIEGNGREGSGIQIVADGNDQWVYSWNIDNVTVENTGGYGLDVRGSVFEGLVSNSWMNGNALGGAYFGHSSGGGQASALRWFGGGFKDNGGAGLTLGNGARDMSIDNALFLNNDGVGISAGSGIASVTGSHFQDNQGPGVWFQNYGNFNGNTFSTSGSQTVGISGYLAGGATLVDNVSTYTGPGADTIALANLQGNGNAFVTGDDGPIITGTGVSRYGSADGAYADVLVSSAGVALPGLPALTAATTAPVPSSTGTGVLEATLRTAMANGQVAHLTDATYTVTAPIVINVTSSTGGPIGIDLGGAKINSQITDGSPVIQIIVGPGVDLATLTLSNFSIQGSGLEGDGIKIVADGADRWIHDLAITNVNVEHVGRIGLDVLGNVSHGSVVNAWMHGNSEAGARFANSAGGGVVNDIDWVGGGFRKNGGAGLVLDNGARDATVQGAYFVENGGPGLHATSGITLVEESGFENNQGAGAIVLGSANFANSSFSTGGPQTIGVAGYLAGGEITLTGLGIEYYGGGANPTVLANVQGAGTVAATGGADIVVGPGIAVTGGQPYSPPSDATAPSLLSIAASGAGISAGTGEIGVGKTVTLTMAFDEPVIVTGGTPTLQLNDGGVATLVGGSGQSVLTFAHTVQPGQNAADLAVLSVSLNGAAIEDAADNAATLSAATNYNPAGILKIDTTAHVSVAGPSTALPEGNLTSTAFTFVVTLSAPSTSNQTVAWTVAGSGANPTNGADFAGGILPSGVLTFSAGETSKSVVASVLGDATPEPSEGFALTLSNPSSGLTIDTPSANATIVDDDGSVSVVAQSAVKTEGNSGATLFTFTVTRGGDSSAARSVSWMVMGTGASAADASDFSGGALPGGTLTFASGEVSKTITVAVASDNLVEGSETFALTLFNPSPGLTIGTASATGTIVNDDAIVSVAVQAAVKSEGNSGSTAFTFTVTRTGDTSGSATASYAVTGSGSAPANAADFAGGVLPSGAVSFAAGETTKTVTLNVAGDSAVEASEGFTLTLSSPSSGVTIGTASATGTIQNDDATLSVAALAAVKSEGNSGSTAFTFTVTRTGDTSGSATASYAATGSGSAPANAADFAGGVLPSGIVSFAAGETTKTITLSVVGDSVVEASEGFTLTLSSPSSGVTIGTASATGAIQNDDATLSVAALAAVKAEGNSGSTAFTFTVTRTGDTSGSATASYAVTGSGSAPANAADFTAGGLPSGTVSFAAGETTKTITLNVAGDTTVEVTETFTVTLSLPNTGTGGSTIGVANAAGSILNDDSAGSTQLVRAVNVGGGQVTASNGVVFQADPGPTTGAAASRTFATTASISGTADDALYQDERWTPGGSYTYEVPVANGTYKVDLLLAEIYYGITGAGQRVFDMAIEGQALAALQNIDIFARVGANAAFTVTQQVTVSDGSLSIQVGPGSSAAGNVENAKLNAFAVYAVNASSPVARSIAAADDSTSSAPTIATASATGTIQNDDVAPPVTAHDDAYIVLQGQSLSVAAGVLLNDENATGATRLGGPVHGTLNLTAGGAFSYIPAPGYFGLDSFSYNAGNAGGADDAQALLYVVPVSAGPTPTLNLTALSVEELVAATYVAFFGRAADAGGFEFWVDEFLLGMSSQTSAGLFANVASSFGVSGEAKALYPFLAHPFAASDSEIGSFLDTLYNNMFNRSADAAGLVYWTSQVRQTLAAGEFVGAVLIDVIGGAQDGGATQDITTLMSKVAMSLHYAREQQQHGTVWSGANDVAAATALLDAVTSDPNTLLMGIRNADNLVATHG